MERGNRGLKTRLAKGENVVKLFTVCITLINSSEDYHELKIRAINEKQAFRKLTRGKWINYSVDYKEKGVIKTRYFHINTKQIADFTITEVDK
jgi:hypothetical protein